AEASLDGAALQNPRGDVFAHGRAVLEAVAGAAPDQPQVVPLRMTVDQEIPVGSVLVLADLASDERRSLQGRKASTHEIPDAGESFRRDDPGPVVRIEGGTVAIGRDLEASSLEVGDPVNLFGEVHPHGHFRRAEARVAGRDPKVVDLLARREDAIAEEIREYLRQPRTTGEDECSRGDRFPRTR